MVNLRANLLPTSAVLLKEADNIVPAEFTHDTTNDDNYDKAVPDAGTDPGTTLGNNSHQHAAGTSHGHVFTGTTIHTHTLATGPASPTEQVERPQNSITNSYAFQHGHSYSNAGPTDAAASVTPTAPADHSSQASEPPFVTVKHIIKSSGAINIRKRSLPHHSTYLWLAPIAGVQPAVLIDPAYFDNYTKGTLNSGTSPGSTGGGLTHQHGSGGSHDHGMTSVSHNHPWPGSSSIHGFGPVPLGSPSSVQRGQFNPPNVGHPAGSLSVSPNTGGPNTSTASSTHQHDSQNHEPQFRTTAFLTKAVINVRQDGVPLNGIVLWNATLASIPTGWTQDTTYHARFPKGITSDITNPGTNGGNANHTHNSIGAHTHTGDIIHTHGGAGTSGPSPGGLMNGVPGGPRISSTGHTHGASSTGPSTVPGTLDSDGAHDHGSQTNDPVGVEVAYIRRV